MIDKVIALKKKYEDWRTDLNNRLDELSKKDLWDLYQEREIHLRYVESMIEDLDNILRSEKTEA